MRVKQFKSMAAAALLAGIGLVATTPFPLQALVFMKEFEKSSRSGVELSVQERVVYSLLEASVQTSVQTECRRAPSTF